MRRVSSSSSPRWSGIPYKVNKNCPKLWRALKVIWRKGEIAQPWTYAEGVFIPNEEWSKNIVQFRIISLLSVESKIFFNVVARRLSDFLLGSNYIDTSEKKGGILGDPGSLEHMGVVTQLIREAREGKGDLAILWLDLTKHLWVIPHKHWRHHIPQNVNSGILQ